MLLYKDSRVDMDLLDETVGAENWERLHTRDNANCTVSIWDTDKKMWISKEDTGTESNTEKEKGLASDSFKRACVNWGIGRELYTAPFIYVEGDVNTLKKDKYKVTEIEYNENREITKLTIVNKKGEVVYPKYKSNSTTQTLAEPKQTAPAKTTAPKTISTAQAKRLFAIAGGNEEIIRKNLQKYGYQGTQEIKMGEYNKFCEEIEAMINTF